MSIESELRKDGIEVVSQLDTLTVNNLAQNIAARLCSAFPDFGLDEKELFIKLSRLNMYIAKMPEGMAEANYFYKNNSIYFNEHIPQEDIEEFAIHECIHHLQEVKDKKNYLIRMGLCDYTEFRTYGLALNEAAVQLMASKVIGIKKDFVKYYGLSFETTSPSYYPLECCLVNQLAFLTGEDVLFESTLNSNDRFKERIIQITSLKTFIAIENAIDYILQLEEEVITLNNKILEIDDRNKKVDNLVQKIGELKNNIKVTFLRTQNLIVSSCFNYMFNQISNLEELEAYRRKLYSFRDYIATADGYTFFNDYYIEKMSELEHKYNVLENGGIETALTTETEEQSKIKLLFRSLKKLVLGILGIGEEA